MKSSLRLISLAFVVAAAVACGEEKKPDGGGAGGGAAPAKSGDAGGAKPAAGAGGKFDKAKATGSIKGVVKFVGKTKPTPKMNGAAGSADAFCKSAGDKILEATEVNADGTLPHAFVYASKGPHDGMTGFDPQPIVIDQVGCTYVPHVTGVMAGQNFTVKTSDKTTHNVKATPQRQSGFNLMQPEGKSDSVSFKQKEAAIKLQCDVHSWMSAYVFCLDHPFYATSSREGGTFEIKGLLPGTYTIKAWHEAHAKDKGGKEYTVEIKDGQTAELTIELGQ